MSSDAKIAALTLATGLMLAAAHGAPAQTVATDPRWYPWLGCWQADASEMGEQSTSSSATCIVPITGSASVEALTIARRRVVARDRLDASGRPHAIDGQGCQGMEVVNWSSTGRRALLRSDYTCASGIKGTTTTVFAISPTGEWLRVEEVRSGGGTTLSVTRLREVGPLPAVSTDAARAIDERRRAIVVARAAAATAITAIEATDAAYTLGESVVRAWLLASDPLGLDSRQVAALTRPDLSMVQALASLSSGYSWPSPYGDNDRDVYMNSSVYVAPPVSSPYEANAPYPCSPLNCYGLNPYSPFNGFGAPFGFAVITTSPFRSHRGRDGKSFNHQFHDGHRPNGSRPWGGRSGGGRR